MNVDGSPLKKVDFTPMGESILNSLQKGLNKDEGRGNYIRHSMNTAHQSMVLNNSQYSELNQSRINQTQPCVLNNLNNSMHSKGNLDLSAQLEMALPAKCLKVPKRPKMNLTKLFNHIHSRYDDLTEKYEKNHTGGFQKNPKMYYREVEYIKQPVFLKSHAPSIEFRWNKTVDRFDVYVLDKKRKTMDIEPIRTSQILDVLAASTQK